mmetsp:Transcript_59902/g.195589  ORF Transcript_59902/g.195589 Transcript_59902/m.195589 type:complete len:260 (+) Transcript_59902:942-1721(+)
MILANKCSPSPPPPSSAARMEARTGEASGQLSMIPARATHADCTEQASDDLVTITWSKAFTATSTQGSSCCRTEAPALDPKTNTATWPRTAIASYSTSKRSLNMSMAWTTAATTAGMSSAQAPSDSPSVTAARDLRAATMALAVLKHPLRIGFTNARAPLSCCTAQKAQYSTHSSASCCTKHRSRTVTVSLMWASTKQPPRHRADSSLQPYNWIRPWWAFASMTCSSQGKPPRSEKAQRMSTTSIMRSASNSRAVDSTR